METNCIFCKIINKEVPASIVTETDEVLVMKDLHPKTSIHYLIIPKKHIKDIQSFEKEDHCLAAKLIFMAQKLSKEIPGTSEFRLIVNSGYSAGQRVFHLHIHFLAGKELNSFE